MKNIIIYFPDTAGYNPTPPYEMLFQAKALENQNIRVVLCDHRTSDIYKILEEHAHHTILFVISTIVKYTSITVNRQFTDGRNIAAYVKKNYSIPLVWTGLTANILENKLLSIPETDFVIKNVDEKALALLVKAANNEIAFTEIPNLSFKNNGKIITNISELRNDSFLLYGDFDLSVINIEDYIHNTVFNYIASTGCINHCSFCSVPMIYAQKWSHNSHDTIIKHLAHILSHKQIRTIHFRDDNFLVNKKFVFTLFELCRNNNLLFKWSAQTSVNIIDIYSIEELQTLKNFGCTNISVGIESGDEFILKKVTKSKTSLSKGIEVIKKIIESGIAPSVTSIISFPYNHGRDFNKTLRYLMKIKLLFPRLSLYCTLFQPIPNSELYKELFQNAEPPDEVLSMNKWTSKQKIHQLKAFEKFYFTFIYKHFYKLVPADVGKKIKWINHFFYPFILLRFKIGYTSFLWEYFLTKRIINKAQFSTKLNSQNEIANSGIRHHTTTFDFGYKPEKNN